MDKLVIDIETKNTFQDVGGYQNLTDLLISFVGVYSYKQDAYLSFFEHELEDLKKLLQNAGLIIGFSINRFDLPILNKHLNINLNAIDNIDILDDIEAKLGHRVGLDWLSQTNLKVGKSAHGLDAIKFYKEGRLEDLKNYCLQDVKITKDLYELGKKQGHLLVPTNYGAEIAKVEFNWQERMPLQTLF
ncbi:MAG: ribonuclease H-like domain-containing protein [Candidatus Harrisonbacteria bacterium]|nr:ribonuclease H-like domain-containing protein [Candidatus Harrisonbacteria bacterium]